MSVVENEVIPQSTESKELAALKKQRADINYRISQLTLKNKTGPHNKAIGRVFYLHSDFIKVPKGQSPYPRITVAGHLDEDRKELHWAAHVFINGNRFSRRVGRMRAMGKAVSSRRKIMNLKSTDFEYVREKLTIQMRRILLSVIEEKIASNEVRVSVTHNGRM